MEWVRDGGRGRGLGAQVIWVHTLGYKSHRLNTDLSRKRKLSEEKS